MESNLTDGITARLFREVVEATEIRRAHRGYIWRTDKTGCLHRKRKAQVQKGPLSAYQAWRERPGDVL